MAQRLVELASKREAGEFYGLRVGKVKYNNNTPRQGNMVFVDMAGPGSQWTEELRSHILGEWETSFTVGRITQRAADKDGEKKTDKEWSMECYEPYWPGPDGAAQMPLWAWNLLQAKSGKPVESTAWGDVVHLPWRPIRQLPVGTWDAFYAADCEEPKAKKARKDGKPRAPTADEGTITEDWNGTGISVYTRMPARHWATASNVLRMKAHDSSVGLVFSLDKERDSKDNVHFDPDEHERLRGLTEEIMLRKVEAGDILVN
jgi:hypothetical protein